jgi:hypothetical protein
MPMTRYLLLTSAANPSLPRSSDATTTSQTMTVSSGTSPEAVTLDRIGSSAEAERFLESGPSRGSASPSGDRDALPPPRRADAVPAASGARTAAHALALRRPGRRDRQQWLPRPSPPRRHSPEAGEPSAQTGRDTRPRPRSTPLQSPIRSPEMPRRGLSADALPPTTPSFEPHHIRRQPRHPVPTIPHLPQRSATPTVRRTDSPGPAFRECHPSRALKPGSEAEASGRRREFRGEASASPQGHSAAACASVQECPLTIAYGGREGAD